MIKAEKEYLIHLWYYFGRILIVVWVIKVFIPLFKSSKIKFLAVFVFIGIQIGRLIGFIVIIIDFGVVIIGFVKMITVTTIITVFIILEFFIKGVIIELRLVRNGLEYL